MAVYAKLAYRDVLTGLGNRAAFVRETQETKQSAAPFGYIMVDVNDLKKVNDTLGHPRRRRPHQPGGAVPAAGGGRKRKLLPHWR